MNRIIKEKMSFLVAVSVFSLIFMASCSNPVAKNLYKCEEEENVTMEFAPDYSFVIYCTSEVRRKDAQQPEDGAEPEYESKTLQIATGTYRVNNKLLTISIGNRRHVGDIYDFKDKIPVVLTETIGRASEITFDIKDSSKLTCNFDGRVWIK